MDKSGDITIGAAPFSRPVRLDRLNRAQAFDFDEVPDQETRAALADVLDARSVSKMRFAGVLAPVGDAGWRLDATLGASVVQTCVATLAPVKARVDQKVTRLFLPAEGTVVAEIDIDPEDEEEIEDLPRELDLGAVALEELALALPAYPRAGGGDIEGAFAGPPGAQASDLEPEKPFAKLAILRDRLDGEET